MEYQVLLEAAPDAIVIVNQSGEIILVNAQAEVLFGYPRNELIGQPAEILVPKHFRNQHSDQHSRFLAPAPERPRMAALELFGLRKDGSEFPAEIRLSPVDTDEGILISSAIRDISGTRRTEEDLRRLASIVACSDDAIIGKTLEGIITSWNAGAKRMYGYSAKEAIGRHVGMLVPIDRVDEIPKMLERLKRGEIVDHFETLRVRKDGQEFHIEITISPIRDATERIVGASTMGRDITQRKRTDVRILEERDRAQQYLDIADVILLALDLKGRITLINRKGCSTLGWEERELLGRDWIEACLPAKTREVLRKSFQNLLVGDLSYIENSILTKSGEERTIGWRNTLLRDRAGRITGTLSSGEDITDRKRADEALRKSEARLQRLAESSIIGIGTGTLDGKFLDGNAAFLNLLGYTREEVLSGRLRWDEMTPPEYRDVDKRAADQLTITGVAAPWEKELIRKDGRRVAVLIGVVMVATDQGDLEAEFFIIDISERKLLEQQLRKSQKMEAVGLLAGGIAHDFNNLLSVIIGYSEILLDNTQFDVKTRSQCEQIKKAGDRAASLTRQLLAFSRQQVLEPRVLNLNTVVLETGRMLKRLIGEDVDLRTALDPTLGAVKADPGQIEQIIMNLVVNARDAMPEGGKLVIETSNADVDETYAVGHPPVSAGRYVLLAVSDNGIGMDEKTQTHIFEPFFTTKELGKGTGLGLSTVYGVVKQSGGYIWVDSELGHGSVFKIYLPRVDEVVHQSPPSELAPEPFRGTETVLLVEDEESVRMLTRSFLEGAGYRVIEARSGTDALEVVGSYSGTIHLLLTDVVMAGMNGPDLADRLTLTHPIMKVLCMSGYIGAFANHNELVARCARLLQKPFSREVLLRMVREALEPRTDANHAKLPI